MPAFGVFPGIVLSGFGIFGNVLALATLYWSFTVAKTSARKAVLLIIIQTLTDLLACIGYLISLLVPPDIVPDSVLCRIIRSRVLFWLFINYRGFLNAYSALWHMTRVVYPFWSTPINSTVGCICLLFFGTSINLLQCFAFLRFINPSSGLRSCQSGCPECRHGDIAGFYAFATLFSVVFRLVLPSMYMFSSYGYLLDCLGDCAGEVYRQVRQQLRITWLLDGWLFLSLLLPHDLLLFTGVFADATATEMNTRIYEVVALVALTYPALSAYLAMCFRRANRMPLMNIILNPPKMSEPKETPHQEGLRAKLE